MNMKLTLVPLRSEERLGPLLGGRSQRRLPGPAIGRGWKVAAGGGEGPRLPAEGGRPGPQGARGEDATAH